MGVWRGPMRALTPLGSGRLADLCLDSSCVSLSALLNLSEPQYLHLGTEDENSILFYPIVLIQELE